MPETVGATRTVGRAAEQARLKAAIHTLAAGRGGLIVLEGEAGVGKSTLAADLLRDAAAAGLRTLAGFGDSLESRTPYFPWRAVCRAALGIHPAATSLTPESRRHLEHILGEAAPLLPLLDAVLAVGLRDTPDTAALTGEARAESLRRVLLRMLPAALGHAPALLLLEDAHWFDTASALLLEQFVESRPRALVVLTCRPGDDPLEPFARMRMLDSCLTLTLGGLSASHCGSIVAHRIGADRVDADVVDLVLARTRGNPLFVVTLVDLLMNAGIVSVVDRVGTIAGTAAIAEADLDAVLRKQGVPSTLEGIMLARLDRLDAGARHALQCASVLGHAFSCHDLQAAGELTETITNAVVGRLVAAGLLVPAPASDGADYEFAHAVVHDVTYHAMAFADRRRLHRVVANRLATSTRGRAGALDVVLAHHFAEAGEHESAVGYLSSAGGHALATYSNLEAVHLLSRALTLSGIDVTPPVPGHTRLSEPAAGLLLSLARAEMRLGRYADTQRHAAWGLAGIGLALPTRRFGAVAGILTEAGRQTAHRWLRRNPRRLDAEQRQRFTGACSSLEDLVEANFFSGHALPAIYCALKTLNLAERCGPSAELARGYATVAGIASVTPAAFIARVYRKRALATLAGLDNPPATVWVSIVIALSLVGSGQWTSAGRLLEEARDVADRIGDRRRWRDAVENLAGIAACRGDWVSAREGVSAMQASAERDKDRRALVSAWRERGFYDLHTSQLDSVVESISRISAELGRGLVTEEAAARHDMLSLSAAVSLERGDEKAALSMAGEAVAIMQNTAAPTFPFNYWAAFAATQVFLEVLDRGGRSNMELDRLTRAGCAVLAREARVYAIAAPALLLCRGRYARLKKRPNRSRRLLRRCMATAGTLHMPFELAAAERELARLNGHLDEIQSRL